MDEKVKNSISNDLGGGIDFDSDFELSQDLDFNFDTSLDLGDITTEQNKISKWNKKFFISFLGLNPLVFYKFDDMDLIKLIIYMNPNEAKFNFLLKNLNEYLEYLEDNKQEILSKVENKASVNYYIDKLSTALDDLQSFYNVMYNTVKELGIEKLEILSILTQSDTREKVLESIRGIKDSNIEMLNKILDLVKGSNMVIGMINKVTVMKDYDDYFRQDFEVNDVIKSIDDFLIEPFKYEEWEKQMLEAVEAPTAIMGVEDLFRVRLNSDITKIQKKINNNYFKSILADILNLHMVKGKKVSLESRFAMKERLIGGM